MTAAARSRAPIRYGLAAILAIAFVLRVLLFIHSPQPFGYVYDLYHQAIQVLYNEHRLPDVADCWVCYHPWLFVQLGFPFYWIGMRVGGDPETALHVTRLLPALCELLFIACGYRLLRIYARRGWQLLLGFAMLCFFPCSFISSGGIEADILLSALMVGFLVQLVLAFNHRRRMGLETVLLVGLPAGFAAATKYSGVLALIVAGEIVVVWLVGRRSRRAAVRYGLPILLVASLVAAPKYVNNWIKYGNPFQGNIVEIGSPLKIKVPWNHYEFHTFRLGDAVDLFRDGAPQGQLTTFDVYRSFWTTLHTMAWTDMSFFSEPTRHGLPIALYPRRNVPLWLVRAVLVVGIAPSALALLGMVVTLRRRSLIPVHLLVATTMLVYVWWIFQLMDWMIKTKYIMFLYPAYVLYALFGLAYLERTVRWKPARVAAVAFAVVAIALTVLYMYRFAVGA